MNRMMDSGGNAQTPHRTGRLQTRSRLILLGSIGHFITAAVCIPYGIISILTIPFLYYARSYGFALSTTFAIALLLHSFSILGLWLKSGRRLGAIAFVCDIFASLCLIFLGKVASESCLLSTSHCYRILPPVGYGAAAISCILLGFALIVEGMAFIKVPHGTFQTDGVRSNGLLYIIAGGLFISVYLASGFGYFILSVAFFRGGHSLSRAPIRPSHIPETKAPPCSRISSCAKPP